MNTTKTNNLSFYNEQGILTLNAKQFDTGRRFVFHIMDNDEPFDLPENCTAYLRIAKADGTQFQGHECCKIEGSKIVIDTSVENGSQILTAAGINVCELHIENAEGISLTTWNFNLLVEPRVHDGSHISSVDSYDILDIAKRNEEVRQKNEQIRLENETQRQENEKNRKEKFEVFEAKIDKITDEARAYATEAKSWTVGGTNTRSGEDTDNSRHYYEQIKSIAESFSGTLRPKGTIAFTNLPSLSSSKEGDMYNISNQFTTNADFKEGSGHIIPSGSNIYKTADGKWDVLAGTPVTGVKGDLENTYRQGNVNITPEDIGALSLLGGIISDDDVSMNITPKGLMGDSAQTIEYFYEIEARNIKGAALYYNDENTDERYVKQENFTPENIGALSLKKGGTVNNNFKVNKESSNNPSGLTELDIHNDGKVAINTNSNGTNSNSLAHFDGAPNTGTITLRGNKLRLYQPNISLESTSNTTINHHGISFENSGGSANLKLISNDVIINGDTNGYSNKAAGAIFNENTGETKLYTNDINIGAGGDYFIEAYRNINGDTTGIKGLKLRGGKYIDAQHQSANIQLEYDATNGNQIDFYANHYNFYSASNQNPLLKIKPTGIEIRDTSNDGFTVNGNARMTGNLRLKGSGNYGNKLNFGDGEYCYLHEFEDDHLKIYANGDALNIGQGEIMFLADSNKLVYRGTSLCPIATSQDLGESANKWKNIYATNGIIQTSDRNEKNTIQELTDEKAKALIYGLKPSTYQMNSGTSGRTHWGMISQDIEALFENLGWTSLDFAGFIKSPKTHIEEAKRDENGKIIKERVEKVIEGEYNYSLRYDEFIAPMIKVLQAQHEAMQKQDERIEALEKRIDFLVQKRSAMV